MSFVLITSSNALIDIQEAIDWENKRQQGLGKRFLYYLEKRFESLIITPNSGSIRYDNVRCTTTKTFPYIIHYIVDVVKERIIILRVLHSSRKPIRV